MIFLLSLVLSVSAHASLSNEQVVQSVLTHFPTILAAELKQEAAEGEETAAKGAFDHKIKHKTRLWRQYPYNNEYYETYIERQTPYAGAALRAGHRQGAGDFNYYDLKKDTSSAGQVFAGLTMPILRNFTTDAFRTGLKVAELEKERAQQEVELKKLVSVHKALSSYYKWVLACRKLEINKGLLSLANERKSMLTRTHKAGDIDRLKVVDNDRAINKRESEVLKASAEERFLALELSMYLRDQNGEPIVPTPIDDSIALLKQETTLGPARKGGQPQANVLSIDRKIQRISEDYARQLRLPGLNVGVMGARELSERNDYGQHILEVGVSFDFPIENRKAEGKTVAYHYKKLALEREIQLLKQQLDQQIKAADVASSVAMDRFKVTDVEFSNTTTVVEGERKKWRLGASDLFTVNLREQDLADVDVRRWTALYEWHQAQLDAGLFSGRLPTEKR